MRHEHGRAFEFHDIDRIGATMRDPRDHLRCQVTVTNVPKADKAAHFTSSGRAMSRATILALLSEHWHDHQLARLVLYQIYRLQAWLRLIYVNLRPGEPSRSFRTY
jgi:hypothetical protein